MEIPDNPWRKQASPNLYLHILLTILRLHKNKNMRLEIIEEDCTLLDREAWRRAARSVLTWDPVKGSS